MRRKFGDSHKSSETRERQPRDIEQDICEGVVRKKANCSSCSPRRTFRPSSARALKVNVKTKKMERLIVLR